MIDLTGAWDTHVHTAPDNRPRHHTAEEYAALAAAAGMAGVVLKNHDEPTVTLAEAARASQPGLAAFGGVTLNRSAGGLDSALVEQTLAAGGRVIWLPTKDGAGAGGGLRVTDDAGAVLPDVLAIFERIAAADAVLATGHVGAHEVLAVVQAARRAGVRRILVNHPEIFFLHYSIDLQKALRDEGALLERCYPRPQGTFDEIAEQMRAVGVESTVLATDLGRVDLTPPVEGLRELIAAMLARGFSEGEIHVASRRNPAALFGAP